MKTREQLEAENTALRTVLAAVAGHTALPFRGPVERQATADRVMAYAIERHSSAFLQTLAEVGALPGAPERLGEQAAAGIREAYAAQIANLAATQAEAAK